MSNISLRKESAELNTNALKNLLDTINPKKSKWLAKDIPLALSFHSFVLKVDVEVMNLNKEEGKYWLYQVSVDQKDFEKLIDYVTKAKQQDSLIPFTASQTGSSTKSPGENSLRDRLKLEDVIFFNNPYGFFPNTLIMKAPDFLVFYKGEYRILEVDGMQHKGSREDDYARDRLFDKFGIRVSRFTHKQCVDNPEAVIKEFMSLFKDYVPKTPDKSVEVIDVDFKKVRK